MLQYLNATLARDVQAFQPELALCATIVILLLIRLFSRFDRHHLGLVALVLTLYGLVVSWCQWMRFEAVFWDYDPRQSDQLSLQMFSGMLVYDDFTIFLRLFLIGFAALVIWLSLLTGIPKREDSADFYVLLLGATLGMCLMASANHLLMIFIAVEMASLPSYALAGYLKTQRRSSEASLKYVVYGSGASGIMLYGMSLLAGKFGSGYLPTIAEGIIASPTLDPMLLLGILFILIGLGFKLAAVPFHFWCPDVFEGAAAEVAGFLSVASKGAALALLGRFALVVAGLGGTQPNYDAWKTVVVYLVPVLGVAAAVTATFGNLAAYAQNNLKRLLAYSTIAHAGYMMMGLATLTRDGACAVLFYLVVYLFMNLGAFAIVAFLRELTGSEDLRSFRGLVTRAPVLVVSLGLCLLSLLGVPPLAGFAAKFQIFRVLFDASVLYNGPEINMPGLSYFMLALLVIAGLNTVLSLAYYVKVLKVMIVDKPIEEVEGRAPEPIPVPAHPAFYGMVMGLSMVVLGILWGPLARGSERGVSSFHALPPASAPRLEGNPQ